MDANRIVELAKLFVARTARSNLQRDHATEEERDALRSAPKAITQPIAQDYAVWRRALLWLAAVVMSVNCAVKLVAWIKALSGEVQVEVLQTLATILFLAIPVSTILTILAATRWSNLRASRRFARFAWGVLFLTPLLTSLVPWVKLTNPDIGKAEQIGLGTLVGFALFFSVAPSAIALCAGVIRSSMTVKTLLPESPQPGWSAVFFGPIYVLLLVSLMVIVNQMLGSVLLMIATGALVAAPLVYVWHAKQMLLPRPESEVTSVVVAIRRKSAIVNLFGIVLLVAWVLDHEMLDAMDLLGLFISFFGAVLLLTVVAADFILAMLCHGHRKARDFFGTALARSLEQKFDALESVGLTRFDVGMHTTEMRAPPK